MLLSDFWPRLRVHVHKYPLNRLNSINSNWVTIGDLQFPIERCLYKVGD